MAGDIVMGKADKKIPIKKKPASKHKRKHEKPAQPVNGKKTAVKSERPGIAWQTAVANPLYRPIKQQVTFRMDADVIAWLRKDGKGYQTKANALLRELMVKDVTRKKG
jgi:uncharacterized protein (DUF4415 family)